jgi:hypothetical protein
MGTINFSDLKKNAEAAFTTAAEAANKNKAFAKDEREWQPSVDKVGNGFAITRPLPAPPGEDVPFVKYHKHAFKGPNGKWFIEYCPTDLGLPCPTCEYNGVLWATEDKAKRAIVSKQKRNLIYAGNHLILADKPSPENEGQVKIFNYGEKIHGKFKSVMAPEVEGMRKFNPFDFYNGANFQLVVRMIEVTENGQKRTYRNYDNSSFDACAPLFDGDDAKLEALWNKEHKLQPLIDPKLWKGYDELKKRLHFVLEIATVIQVQVPANVMTPQDEDSSNPNFSQREDVVNHDDNDDDKNLFQALANED